MTLADPVLVADLTRTVQDALVTEATSRVQVGKPPLTRAGQEALAEDERDTSAAEPQLGLDDVAVANAATPPFRRGLWTLAEILEAIGASEI